MSKKPQPFSNSLTVEPAMPTRLISFAVVAFVVPALLHRHNVRRISNVCGSSSWRRSTARSPLNTGASRDAPTAISIVTGEDIRRASVSTLADAVARADNLHVARVNKGTCR